MGKGERMSARYSVHDIGEAGTPLPTEFLHAFIDRATSQVVRKGSHILVDGDISQDVYVVISGEIQFALYSESGKEIILRNLGPDRLFGEMAILTGAPRSVSAMTLKDSKLARMSGNEFYRLLTSFPEACYWLNQQLALRVENLTRKTYALATQSVTSRIIGELLRLCEEGQNTGGITIIKNLPVHAKLAAKVGTHREAVTKEIAQLTKDGLVKKSGRDLIILSSSGLRALYARLFR